MTVDKKEIKNELFTELTAEESTQVNGGNGVTSGPNGSSAGDTSSGPNYSMAGDLFSGFFP
jgi:hypothetical protein